MTNQIMLDSARELDILLGETLADAKHREQTAFERALEPFSGRVVIYGAGNLGRRTLSGLRETGIDVLAFADRNPTLWSHTVDGIRVCDPQEAAFQFGNSALFVVALWHPTRTGGIESVARALRGLGCQGVISFVPLYWRYPAQYLPYYMWDLPSQAIKSSDRVRSAFDLFLDHPASQSRYVKDLRLRIHGDFACPEPPADHDQYFPGLFRPVPEECFVDCGAYDGDTIHAFLEWSGGVFSKIIAFEPDPKNAEMLRAYAEGRSDLGKRLDIRTSGVAESAGGVSFLASGGSDARICQNGDVQVSCVSLDEALGFERATFVKMDIEGAEMAALRGARTIMRRDRPIIAACVYHQQDHLWEVPLIIASQQHRMHLALSGYCQDGLDTICYSVPHERSLVR